MKAASLKRAGWRPCRDDFPELYTLTSANRDLTFIVNLTGSAEIYLHEAEEMKRIWQQIVDRSRAFFMQHPAKGPALS